MSFAETHDSASDVLFTGVAKLGMLLKVHHSFHYLVFDVNPVYQSLSPKVLMVEEAGQVLEAHVLGSLVPSVEHLILIGDPLQLQPTLNNFSMLCHVVHVL